MKNYRDARSSLPEYSPDWCAGALDKLAAKTVMRDNGCQEWTGPLHKTGYAYLGWGNKVWKAHRLMMAASRQKGLGQAHVLHKCDNPKCCRLEHLFLGDAAANARDRAAKGRGNDESRSGEANCNAKLTKEMVKLIRSSPLSGGQLGRELGVTRHNIGAIRRGETWRNV